MSRSLTALALLVVCMGTGCSAEDWVAPAMACKEPLADGLAPPQGASVAAVFNGTVTRTFTCPNTEDYETTTEFKNSLGEVVGEGSGSSNNPRQLVFFAPGGSAAEPAGTVATDSEADISVEVVEGEAEWERRPVSEATGAAVGTKYIIRTDTSGSGSASCEGMSNGDKVEATFSGVYTFYSCKE